MLDDEDLIPLAEAFKHVPGHRPHKMTPVRWALRGKHGVRLESKRVGSRRYTSKPAIVRFLGAVAVACESQTAAEQRRARELNQIDDELRGRGLLKG